MSAPPDFVIRLENFMARYRQLGKELAELLHEMSAGTAKAEEVCGVCNGVGTRFDPWQLANIPCGCEKGRPFRAAAAIQQRNREREAPRFLTHGETHTKESGRDRATGERE